MVLPNFVKQALSGQPITVFGDGAQTRCFCHVQDATWGLARLMACPQARGEVVNIGTAEEISIAALARQVKESLGSRSEIRNVPYQQAYRDGFEDMERRVPCLEKALRLIGYRPRLGLADCNRDTAAQRRAEEPSVG
jgi:UDP-glucose 4-epimerase